MIKVDNKEIIGIGVDGKEILAVYTDNKLVWELLGSNFITKDNQVIVGKDNLILNSKV